jgi:methylmalonyl-CoA mutase N-terminal domain/subunit
MGGAHFMCIQTYDQLSTAGPSTFGQRMALNIGNLISEEAQLSILKDPLQGAYLIEQLTLALLKKSWALLCHLDGMGQAAPEKLKEAIIQTRNIRLEQFHSGANTLIGINAFMNEFDSPKAEWAESPTVLGLPYLILEKIAV